MSHNITLITEPTVLPIAEMTLIPEGLNSMMDWVADYRPECLPEKTLFDKDKRAMALFPHYGTENERSLTGNELLVELAGRSCYHSYGAKAGRKSNAEYIDRMLFPQAGTLPHGSVAYHAKMSFFIAGVSRRLSHELIRHYVGSDRDEEGSPSQESTRYTEHPGFFVVHPYLNSKETRENFFCSMARAYFEYQDFLKAEISRYKYLHGIDPSGKSRKRIYEAAAGYLPMQAATSFVWTSNPAALTKLFKERTDEAADAEFQRLAGKWQAVCRERWPNLFR